MVRKLHSAWSAACARAGMPAVPVSGILLCQNFDNMFFVMTTEPAPESEGENLCT